MKSSPTSIPLSLYIHVPWCERKCPYCDFNSHQSRTNINEAEYINALLADLDQDISEFRGDIADREIQSIFIGGGTPSLFSAQSYETLFKALEQRLSFSEAIEITLEANPGSSEREKFIGFRQAGINRLSIGIQSFNNEHLQKLGRIHSSADAGKAAQYAKQAGFNNFNLDLMFGLPSQNLEQAVHDLSQAIALAPTHLSLYQLTIEPNTLFHHSPPITPDDDTLWDMQLRLQQDLASQGYQQYEVSAYAKKGCQCKHNLNYWQFGDYLGIGAGAHGKLTTNSGIFRRWKTKHPASYMQQNNKVGGHNKLDDSALPFEFMLNALRLNSGFSLDLFELRTQQQRSHIQSLLDKHQDQGLITVNADQVTPTEFGHNMLNDMLHDYLALDQSQ